MKPIKIFLCLFIACASFGCTSYTTVRQHKNFRDNIPKYHSVAIFPADMFTTYTGKGGDRISPPDPEMLHKIIDIAQKELIKKGYKISDIIIDDAFDSEDSEVFKGAYQKIIKAMYKNKEDGNIKNAFSRRDNIGLISKGIVRKSNADMLLVLGYTGKEMSQDYVTKKLIMDIAVDVAVSALTKTQSNNISKTRIKEGLAMISLIDRKNGDVMWTDRREDYESYSDSIIRILTKKNIMETAFKDVIRQIPGRL